MRKENGNTEILPPLPMGDSHGGSDLRKTDPIRVLPNGEIVSSAHLDASLNIWGAFNEIEPTPLPKIWPEDDGSE